MALRQKEAKRIYAIGSLIIRILVSCIFCVRLLSTAYLHSVPSCSGIYPAHSVCAQFFLSLSIHCSFVWRRRRGRCYSAQSHTIEILKWITHVHINELGARFECCVCGSMCNRMYIVWTNNVYLAIAIVWNICRYDYQRIIFPMCWMWVASRTAHLITMQIRPRCRFE